MALEIKVGPPQLAIHHGSAVLLTQPDGQIPWPTAMGLYFLDTRMLSTWSIYANGVAWELLNSGTPAYHLARIYLTNGLIPTEDGPIAPRTLSLVIGRQIEGGMREEFTLTNHSVKPVRLQPRDRAAERLRRHLRGEGWHRVRRGRITSEWSDADADAGHALHQRGFPPLAERGGGRRARARRQRQRAHQLRACAGAGEMWQGCLAYDAARRRHRLRAARRLRHRRARDRGRPHHGRVAGEVTRLESSNDAFERLYGQALDDMAALRLPFMHGDATEYRARRRPAVVRGAVRPRQPDRVAAERAGIPGLRPRRAGRAGRVAGNGARRLPRRRTRQDPARAAPRRAGALQADPAHAVLRHRRCDAALPDHAAHRLALHRRPRDGRSGCCR